MGNKGKFGTGEWSDVNRNCMFHCKNGCAYCYSRANALKKGEISERSEWETEVPDFDELNKKQVKIRGLVMFPSRHDTTPDNLEYTLPYLTGLLEAGNHVLFVTKASLFCIKEVCRTLEDFKDKLIIRITIGSMNPVLCKFWERNAPHPQERLQALQYAFNAGFNTSVSMEPMLHGVEDAIETFRTVEPFVTEKIWIGPMNNVGQRADMNNINFRIAAGDIRELQSWRELERLMNELKDEPKIEWKESMFD